MKVFFLLFLLSANLVAQNKPAYKLFTAGGKEIAYDKLIKELSKADVVLFGELHDNALNHWLELQVAKDLYAVHNGLVLGMEMFEADDQIVLNEYLDGTIEEKHLLAEAKVWSNYKNDYSPVIEFARAKKLKTVATNIPRRYANLVYRKGIAALNSLPEDGKKWMAPLPVEVDLSLAGYSSMTTMGGHGSNASGVNMGSSQAIKDATMAHFIVKNRSGIFLHFNGTYHSQNYEGISWYLKKYDPTLSILTIHPVEQDSVEKLEDANRNKANFIICIPADMTKTF